MCRGRSRAGAGLLACIATLCLAAAAHAQTNERTYESLGFRVVTPGARAVAMGKTFVGIADDATAAASNPAGLSNLFDPEVSFEWSAVDIRHRRMITANPLTTRAFSELVTFPSFASFVTPMPDVRALRNVTLAVFYDSLQHYEEHFDIPNSANGGSTTEGGYRGDLNIRARSIGLGGAVLLSGQLSVGGSITWQHLTNDTEAFEYVGVDNPRVNNGSRTHDSDGSLGGQIGVLYKPVDRLSIGAAYYSGTTFHLTTTLFGLFSPENSPPRLPQPVETFKDPVQPIDYRIPDRGTIGVAIRPRSDLVIVADAGLVRYSQRITPGFLIVDFLGQRESAKLERDFYERERRPYPYVIDDVVELHAGAEYRRIAGGRVIAVRGGVFTEPNHQMRFDYERSFQTPQARGQEIRFNSYMPGTVVSVTGGGGIVLGNRIQLDAAFSVSSSAREFVLSSVVRFPR